MVDKILLEGRRSNAVLITGHRDGEFIVNGRRPKGLSTMLHINWGILTAILARPAIVAVYWNSGDREAISFALPLDGDRDQVMKLTLPLRRRPGRPLVQPPDVAAIIEEAGGCSAIAERIVSKKTGKSLTRQAVSMWQQVPEEHCRLVTEMSGRSAREVWFAGKGSKRFDIFALAEAVGTPSGA
jgi:hypothetical protein